MAGTLSNPGFFFQELPDYQFAWFNFGDPSEPIPDVLPDGEAADEDSGSTSSSSLSTSDDAAEVDPKPQKKQSDQKRSTGTKGIFPDHLVYGQYRCVVHAMIEATEPAHWLPQRDGKPACGRPMKSNGQLLDCVTAEHQLCQHAACRKLWAHFNLEQNLEYEFHRRA